MGDFWDLNNDGKLDIGEKSMRDATILSILDEEDEPDIYTGGSSAPIATGLGKILLVIGIIMLLMSIFK